MYWERHAEEKACVQVAELWGWFRDEARLWIGAGNFDMATRHESMAWQRQFGGFTMWFTGSEDSADNI